MKSWMKILIALAAGIVFGLFFGDQYKALGVVGKIFIDLLKMLVGILVFSSIVTGICHIHDPRKLGRIGLRTLTFFTVTSLIAICAGIAAALIIKPGAGVGFNSESSIEMAASRLGVLDFIASMVPSNPFAAVAIKAKIP